MDNDYVHLMSVYNSIESENVIGILELEGIRAIVKPSGPEGIISQKGVKVMDIYVQRASREDAMGILETEMARGDL